MAYATTTAFILAFGKDELIGLTDRVNNEAVVEAVAAPAYARADSEANGYIALRYAVPLLFIPVALQFAALDMARYYLYDNRPTEEVRIRYERAVSWLRDVAAGRTVLVDADGVPFAGNTTALSAVGAAVGIKPIVYNAAFDTRYASQVA